MNFKSGINKILPLTPEMVLIYGASNMRDFAQKSAFYLIPKQEILKLIIKYIMKLEKLFKKIEEIK